MHSSRARHIPTRRLLASVPSPSGEIRDIPGEVPSLIGPPAGCRFHPRCDYATAECRTARPTPRTLASAHEGVLPSSRRTHRDRLVSSPSTAPLLEIVDLVRYFPCATHSAGASPGCGPWTACRSRCGRARRSASSGRAVAESRRSARPPWASTRRWRATSGSRAGRSGACRGAAPPGRQGSPVRVPGPGGVAGPALEDRPLAPRAAENPHDALAGRARAGGGAILSAVGLPDAHLDLYPHEPERRPAAPGRARPHPDAAPAHGDPDEPTSGLDVSVQASVLKLFRSLQATFALTYVFISHDLSVVRVMCARIAVMYLGKIVELGEDDGDLRTPGHPYTQSLLAAVPRIGGRRVSFDFTLEGEPPNPRAVPSGCRFRTRCPLAQDRLCRGGAATPRARRPPRRLSLRLRTWGPRRAPQAPALGSAPA